MAGESALRAAYARAAKTRCPLAEKHAVVPIAVICSVAATLPKRTPSKAEANKCMLAISDAVGLLGKGECGLIQDLSPGNKFHIDRRAEYEELTVIYRDIQETVRFGDETYTSTLCCMNWLFQGLITSTVSRGDILALALDSEPLSALLPGHGGGFSIGELIPTLAGMRLPASSDKSGDMYLPLCRLEDKTNPLLTIMSRLLPILMQLCIPRMQATRMLRSQNTDNVVTYLRQDTLPNALMAEAFDYLSLTTPGLRGLANLYLFTRLMAVQYIVAVGQRQRLPDLPRVTFCSVCECTFEHGGDAVEDAILRHVAICPFAAIAADLLDRGRVRDAQTVTSEPSQFSCCRICGCTVSKNEKTRHEANCAFIFDKMLQPVERTDAQIPPDVAMFFCSTCKKRYITIDLPETLPMARISAQHRLLCGKTKNMLPRIIALQKMLSVYRTHCTLIPALHSVRDQMDGFFVERSYLDPSYLQYAILNTFMTPIGGTAFGRPAPDKSFLTFSGESWTLIWNYFGNRKVSTLPPTPKNSTVADVDGGTLTPKDSEPPSGNITPSKDSEEKDYVKEKDKFEAALNRLSLRRGKKILKAPPAKKPRILTPPGTPPKARRRKDTPRRLTPTCSHRDSRSRSRSLSRGSKSSRSCSPQQHTAKTRNGSNSTPPPTNSPLPQSPGKSQNSGALRRSPRKTAVRKYTPRKSGKQKRKHNPNAPTIPIQPVSEPPPPVVQPTTSAKQSNKTQPSLPLRRRGFAKPTPELSLTSLRKLCHIAGVKRIEKRIPDELRKLADAYLGRFIDLGLTAMELEGKQRLKARHLRLARSGMDRQTYPYREVVPKVYGDTIESDTAPIHGQLLP